MNSMRLARYNGERNLWDLVGRLYAIKGTGAVERTRQAGEALLSANPHLGDLTQVPDGVVIVVPNLTHSPPTGEAKSPTRLTGPLLDEVHRRLAEARGLLEDSLNLQETEARRTLEHLQAVQQSELTRSDPEAKQQIDEIRQATQADLEEAERRRTDQDQLFMQMQVDLESLMKRLG